MDRPCAEVGDSSPGIVLCAIAITLICGTVLLLLV